MLRIEKRRKKGGAIYSKIAVNLICTFSYGNHYVHVQSKSYFINLCMNLYLLLWSMTPFLWNLLSSCDVSESIVYDYLCPSFTFTEKSDFGFTVTLKIELVLSVTSIITIKVRVLQMIWVYVASFMVCHSVCPFFCIFERYTWHDVIEPALYFSGAWNPSRLWDLVERRAEKI